MHFRAIIRDRKSGLVGGELGRGAVFIRCANEQDLIALGALETSVGIRGKHRANKIAEMLYPVDVGQR